jgi:hypothetical protein
MREMKFLILMGLTAIFALNIAHGEANITGSYEKQGIYEIQDMSASERDSTWKFIGYVKNISNETFYIDDIVIEMFDSDNKLIEFTTLGQGTVIDPGNKLPYRLVANDINASNFDHYLVRVLGNNNSQGNISAQTNSNYPEELFDECVRVAGQEFCDFLFRR